MLNSTATLLLQPGPGVSKGRHHPQSERAKTRSRRVLGIVIQGAMAAAGNKDWRDQGCEIVELKGLHTRKTDQALQGSHAGRDRSGDRLYGANLA